MDELSRLMNQTAALLAENDALLARVQSAERRAAECRVWHCSGHRQCELERGHDGRHFTTSLGKRFPGWDDSASVDVPKLLEALNDARAQIDALEQRAERAEAERAEWEEMSDQQLESQTQMRAEIDAISRDLEAARAEASELRSALVRWGEHDRLCKRGLYPGIGTCSCGLTAALSAPKPAATASNAGIETRTFRFRCRCGRDIAYSAGSHLPMCAGCGQVCHVCTCSEAPHSAVEVPA